MSDLFGTMTQDKWLAEYRGDPFGDRGIDERRLLAIIDRHEVTAARIAEHIQRDATRHHWHFTGPIDHQVDRAFDHYHELTTTTIASVKAFRDDVERWFRAAALIAESVANASTHSEKNARLRGLVELAESAAATVRRETFDWLTSWHAPDIFRCDYPTRQYIERIHELERIVASLQQEPTECQP